MHGGCKNYNAPNQLQTRVELSREILNKSDQELGTFLHIIVMGDETVRS